MTACHYHPEDTALGICIRCRVPICSACTTRMQGINHCHACLRTLAHTPTRPRLGVGPLLGSLALLGFLWLILTGILWLLQGRLAP